MRKLAILLIPILVLALILTAVSCSNNENESTFTVGVPTVEGPITEPGEPFDRAIKAGRALADDGYEAKEFFISGTATSYSTVDDLPDNGVWEVEQAETAAYKTRILVYRPVDPAEFNGTLVVEWLNVTAGIEAAPDYKLLHTELLRRGYAWIGVSAQYLGVEGGDASHSMAIVEMDLKTMDPERYGSLSHPGDSYSYDIYSQVAAAIRNPGEVDPLAGYDVERILAVGESQSAFRLTTYINAVHPHVQLYDGFLVHSRGGNAAPLRDDPGYDMSDFSGGIKLRTDLDTPVLILQTETDIFELGYYVARQDDTDYIRLWEMAGTAHADLYLSVTGEGDDGTDPAIADLAEEVNPNPFTTCDLPINSGPQHFIAKAALHQLDQWVRTGIAPSSAPRFEITGDTPAFVVDVYGNVVGGIRTPYVDVPIARLSGEGQPAGSSSQSLLYGVTELFDGETLLALYTDHATYVAAVEEATDVAVQAGYLMSEDGALIKAAAAASSIGEPITEPEPEPEGLTINSSIQDILAYPGGEALLRSCLGDELVDNPQFSMAGGYSVPQLAGLSASITEEMVACVEAGLPSL
ncbi:alpha/beta hydrolase domain-containing protein [Chloroflexota bacterium]